MSSRDLIPTLDRWNRKLHIYIGLYLLLFLWLFAATGLLLNHPRWKFAQFWEQRRTSTREQTITWPTDPNRLRQAESLLRQLGLTGEIDAITLSPDGGLLEVRALKPGTMLNVKADRATNRARIEQVRINAWGIMHVLHTFTGVRPGEPAKRRDWIMTRLWSFAMDVLSVGLVLLVLGGLAIWFVTKQKRGPGLVALLLGTFCCGAFFLLGWLT